MKTRKASISSEGLPLKSRIGDIPQLKYSLVWMFISLVTITLVLYGTNPRNRKNCNEMQDKQASIFFLEVVAIVTMLAALSAVAFPDAGQMVNYSRAMAREKELDNIQMAVTAMLDDSATGTLESVGPTADICRVHTRDLPPLVLKDYLPGGHNHQPGGVYGFTSDGIVVQMVP